MPFLFYFGIFEQKKQKFAQNNSINSYQLIFGTLLSLGIIKGLVCKKCKAFFINQLFKNQIQTKLPVKKLFILNPFFNICKKNNLFF